MVIARERLAELESERIWAILINLSSRKQSELEQSLLRDLDLEQDSEELSIPGAWRRTSGAGNSRRVRAGVYAGSLLLPGYAGPWWNQNPAPAEAHTPGGGLPSVEQMVGALIGRLEQNPEDTQGWYLLRRTNMALKDYAGRPRHLSVHQLVGDEPSVLLAWADALAMNA